MNVLSIGNEFTGRAHRLIPQMAQADGKELLLCNLFLPNCSLEQHWDNWRHEKTDYFYEVYLPFETKADCPDGVAIHEAVEDEDWDIIALCQSNGLSGIRESYTPYLSELAEYCRMVKPDARIMLFQNGAFETERPATAFSNYGINKQEIYRQLTEVCVEAALEAEIDLIIPAGRALQSARQTEIADRLTGGGAVSDELTDYLCGACFYEMIFNESIYNNGFYLPNTDISVTNLLRLCSHTAVDEGIMRK